MGILTYFINQNKDDLIYYKTNAMWYPKRGGAVMIDVLFFSDNSEASARIAKGLNERGIAHKVVQSTEYDLLPTLKVGNEVFESMADIQFYYFGRLDRARKRTV